MKKIALVVFLTTLLAGAAYAQLDPDEDGIGVYFDPCACVNCLTLDAGTYTGYLVITHPTSPEGVGGYEAAVWAEGPAVVTNWTNMGQAIDVGTRENEHIVGFGTPLVNPYMFPAVVVAMMDVIIIDTTEPVNFYIDAIYFHSLPDPVPAYLDGGDYDTIKELRQSTGGPDFPVATINGDCAVATEPVSFDDVKALYR